MPTVQELVRKIQKDIESLNRRIVSTRGGSDTIHADTREPTGFIDRTEVTLTFNDANRRLTIAPSGVSFSFYYNGNKFTKNASENIIIPDVEGVHLIYYDSVGTLQQIANPSNAQIAIAFTTYCVIAYIYWDVSEATGQIGNELHGCVMDNLTHLYHHETIGAKFDDGMGLGDFVISDGADDEDAQFSVEAGEFFDEDIEHELAAVSKLTGLQIWYRVGANWFWTTNAGFSVITTGSGRLGYDNAGVLTEVTNNRYVLCHVFATHVGTTAPTYIAIVGQAQYLNINDARDGAETEIASLAVPGTIVMEGVPLASIIFQTNNGYANAVQAKIVQTATGENYIDWRTVTIAAGMAAGDHGLLSGLGDDDHIQYLLIAGTRAMTGPLTVLNEGLHILDTNASHDLIIKAGSDLSADRILSFVTGDAARTITLLGNPTLADWFDQSVKQAASPTFVDLTLNDTINIGDGADVHIIKAVQEPGLGGRLTLGLDETARAMVICDYGDVDVDFGLGSQANPTLWIVKADGTFPLRIQHDWIYSTGTFNVQADSLYLTGPNFYFRPNSLDITMQADRASGHFLTIDSLANIELTAPAAEQAWMYLEPKIHMDQAPATGHYIGFLMNVLEATLGSGPNELMALRVAGVDKFTVDRVGNTTLTDLNIGKMLNLSGAPEAVTIAGGIIAVTESYVEVDTQGGAGTDDLDTINGGTEGDIIILKSANSARDIVVKDLTGNIILTAADRTLANVFYRIMLQYIGTHWVMLSKNF